MKSKSLGSLLGVVFVASSLTGCGEERLAEKRLSIAEGDAAPNEKSVFLMEPVDGSSGTRCSAVLLAPHLLLTAAHCFTGSVTGVDCASDRIGAKPNFAKFRFTNLADVTIAPPASVDYSSASSVTLLEGELLCGNDWALVELVEGVPSSVGEPSEASFVPVKAGSDSLRAVGYGAGHSAGTGEGVKRSSVVSKVLCVGAECAGESAPGVAGAGAVSVPEAVGLEFATNSGACPGDSGGALFDETGAVRGIVSRGSETCGPSIATPVTVELARKVAELAEKNGDEIPAWTSEPEVVPPSVGGAGGASSGSGGNVFGTGGSAYPGNGDGNCAFGRTRAPSGGTLALLATLAALGVRRTKRTMKNGKLAALSMTALLLLGCTRNFTDTEGRGFVEVCEGDKCELHEKGEGETPRFRFEESGSVLSVCPFESKRIQECRALVCESGSDCSPKGNSGFGCDEGLCRNGAKKRSTDDKIVECQSGLGAWSGTVKQRERLTLAVACSEGCELPAECRTKKKTSGK